MIGRSGASFGKVHYCPDDYWPLNTALFATDFLGNEPRFVYYALKTIEFAAFNSGSAQASLNRNFIASIPVLIPPCEEQRGVVEVLGAFDDKIDSNRRLAVLLEDTAATLFRARFVDFVGEDDFEESDIGRVPRGWQLKTLGEVVEQRRERGVDALPYIGLDDMPRGSTVLERWKTDGAPSGQSSRFGLGDILFGKLRPYFKKVGIAPIDGRCSTEIVVLRPRAPELFGLSIGHLTSPRFFDHCDAVATGTRMPRAEWKLASQLRVACPPTDQIVSFNGWVRAVYDQIVGLTHESRRLVEIRDALLPKVISGEMRVPDVTDLTEVPAPASKSVAGVTP